MSKNDGGSAFPCPIAMNAIGNMTLSNEYACGGMTLRDYFAAKAMQNMITEKVIELENLHKIPPLAYELADAMLAERSKP